MPLEGLRAWIGEVERKLGTRTRVMLALAAIAIGIAGAAVYLAVDAHDTAVSEADVQALQQRLEERIAAAAEAGGGAGDVTRLESEVQALKAEVEALKEGPAKKGATAKEPETGGLSPDKELEMETPGAAGHGIEGSTGTGSGTDAPSAAGAKNEHQPGASATEGSSGAGPATKDQPHSSNESPVK
jgi:cell division protein FtsB